MSHREIDRLAVIQSIEQRRLTQIQAALQLGISVRQVKRLVRAYRAQGAKGLVSRHRGKRPNNTIAQAVREHALNLVRTSYADFSPTFAHEKLTEQHALTVSVETLRKWMIEDELWVPRSRKPARIHQNRVRRPRAGELIQIDGSPHDWFEGRAPRCTLIVFIDDATSRLMALRFAPAETTQAYMETLRLYLGQHGRPVALYSDKHSIFRVNRPDGETDITQFTRALKTLDIEPIHANSPQAKGRVERANQTLQDRLTKEMRLQGICSIDEANRFLPAFIEDYNRRFAVAPQHPEDAHRPVLHSAEELALIFTLHHVRKLSKNLAFQFQNTEYQLTGYGQGYRLRSAQITVCEAFDGTITLLHKGQTLTYRRLELGEKPVPVSDQKTVSSLVDSALERQCNNPRHKPAPDHPWRQSFST